LPRWPASGGTRQAPLPPCTASTQRAASSLEMPRVPCKVASHPSGIRLLHACVLLHAYRPTVGICQWMPRKGCLACSPSKRLSLLLGPSHAQGVLQGPCSMRFAQISRSPCSTPARAAWERAWLCFFTITCLSR